jgi:hypothetical protein
MRRAHLAQAKFGAPEIVARFAEINSSHGSPGRA